MLVEGEVTDGFEKGQNMYAVDWGPGCGGRVSF